MRARAARYTLSSNVVVACASKAARHGSLFFGSSPRTGTSVRCVAVRDHGRTAHPLRSRQQVAPHAAHLAELLERVMDLFGELAEQKVGAMHVGAHVLPI